MNTTDRLNEHEAAIIGIMEDQQGLYTRLIEIAAANHAALMASNTELLATLTCEMDALTRAIQRLEQRRITQVALLTGADGRASLEDLTAQHLSASGTTRLGQLRVQMLDSLERLRTANRINGALVQQALTVADQCVRLLRNTVTCTYAPGGTLVGPAGPARAWCA